MRANGKWVINLGNDYEGYIVDEFREKGGGSGIWERTYPVSPLTVDYYLDLLTYN